MLDLIDHQLIINEQEAKFVKKIYHWYAHENYTLRQIGDQLYKLGAVPKRKESKNWSASSIQRVLTSEIYIGKFYYNRRNTKKVKGEKTNAGAPRKTYNFRDENEWIELEVPAIVEIELFELAQQQRAKNTKKSGNIKYDYLLKSMVRCGHCGRMWQATTYSGRVHKETGMRDRYSCYRCPNLFPRKYGEGVEKCVSKTIRSDKLDAFVWQLIMDTLSDPDDYLERLNQKSGNLTEEISDASELIQKQILLKDRELEKVKIMFKRDIIDEDEMASEYQKINQAVKQLEDEYQKYRMQIQQFTEQKLNADRIKEISKRVQDFVINGGNILSLEQKQHIIQSFIDEIIIQFDGDQVQVTAMGVLDEFKTEQFIRTASNDVSSCTQPQEVVKH